MSWSLIGVKGLKTLLILTVCRTHVINEPCNSLYSPLSLCSSVVEHCSA